MTRQSRDNAGVHRRHRRVLLPDGWTEPKGYANGIVTKGTFVFLGGQIGWNRQGVLPAGFVAQTRQALENIAQLLREAEAEPQDVVRLVWYVTDMAAYADNLKELGKTYREIFGYHYPPMTLVQVMSLVEPGAMVEIEATAVMP